jgi:hypothetical protein
MAFERTYNDRVGVLAQGRSRQDGTPSPDNPSPILFSAGAMRIEGRNLLRCVNEWETGTPVGWIVTPSSLTITSLGGKYTNPIHVAGQITLSAELDRPEVAQSNRRWYLFEYDANDILITSTALYTSYATKLLVSETRIIRLFFNPSSSAADFPITWSNIQVMRGYYATGNVPPYTPYRPIITQALPELRGIPGDVNGLAVMDGVVVERVAGEWHLQHRKHIYRYTFNGLEPFYYSAEGINRRVYVVISQLGVAGKQSGRAMSNRYKLGIAGGGYPPVGYCALNSTPVMLFGVDATINSAADFKTLLASWHAAGDPLYVDFELATPILTDLGPIGLPSYYPHTRVLVTGDYPPEVAATCKVVEV